jgi:hypothetical protein
VPEAEAVSGFATRPQSTPNPADDMPILGAGQTCAFIAAETPADAIAGVAVVRVSVYDLGADAATKFAAYESMMAAANNGSIDELGDENFYTSLGPQDVGIVYMRNDNLMIIVTALVPGGLEHATRLARLTLQRL